MSAITIQSNPFFEFGEVDVPSSKSLSNRALIIRELCNTKINIQSLSDSDDTQNLLYCLNHLDQEINVGAAGTNMRFLMGLLASKPGKYILTGNERMQKRPVAELINSLRMLGAEIDYKNNEGYPPVQITGKHLAGGKVKMDGSISSQFISSLLMIAPTLENGLEIELMNPLVSKPYIEMTIGLMKYFGIECKIDNNILVVPHQTYQQKEYEVEADWSSAAFWYGLIATAKIGTRIFLKKITAASLQGDCKSIKYFGDLGVNSIERNNGMLIEKISEGTNHLSFDLINEPDLFPVLSYCCASLRLIANFTGLQTLNLKESKRIETTRTELEKTGAICESGENYFTLLGYQLLPDKIVFDVYNDHRLAMAATMFISSCSSITVKDKEVVSKSYPTYWETLQLIGIANIY